MAVATLPVYPDNHDLILVTNAGHFFLRQL
jgi:hypothetical protein